MTITDEDRQLRRDMIGAVVEDLTFDSAGFADRLVLRLKSGPLVSLGAAPCGYENSSLYVEREA